jgi:hypothetical protein
MDGKHAMLLSGRRREPIAPFLAYWNAQVVLGLMASAAVAQDCDDDRPAIGFSRS